MLTTLIQLVILFSVIFDPLASFFIFVRASYHMDKKTKIKTALMAILLAGILSALVLLLGKQLLSLFSTSIDEFRIAGGIVLIILGIRMTLGMPRTSLLNRAWPNHPFLGG